MRTLTWLLQSRDSYGCELTYHLCIFLSQKKKQHKKLATKRPRLLVNHNPSFWHGGFESAVPSGWRHQVARAGISFLLLRPVCGGQTVHPSSHLMVEQLVLPWYNWSDRLCFRWLHLNSPYNGSTGSRREFSKGLWSWNLFPETEAVRTPGSSSY